jgi:hypothetical protein
MAVISSTTVSSGSVNTIFGSIAYFESIVQIRLENLQGNSSNKSQLRESLIMEALSFLDQEDLENEKRIKEFEIIDYVVTKFKLNVIADLDSNSIKIYEERLSKLKGYLKNIYSVEETVSNSSSSSSSSSSDRDYRSGIYANQDEESEDTWTY